MTSQPQLPLRSKRPSRPNPSPASGHTIIELLVAFSFLVIGAFAFLRVMVSASNASSVNYEVALAKEAARAQMEWMMSLDYKQAFARFNASEVDNPPAPALSPGPHFAVPGLDPVAGDPDGFVGEIIFPTLPGSASLLREDLVNTSLGTPLDLNGDQLIDSSNHTDDCLMIPVLVRITWSGRSGRCVSQFKTILGAMQ